MIIYKKLQNCVLTIKFICFFRRRYSFKSTAEREIVREMKERLSYVATDFELEMMTATCSVEMEQGFDMRDCQNIVLGKPRDNLSTLCHKRKIVTDITILGNERFRGPEIMFQPSFLGRECLGVHDLVHNSIMKSDIDIRRDLWQNLILAGGNTMFPGFAERLQKELKSLAPHVNNIKVIAPPERKYLAWIGGALWAQAACFQNKWISKEEYDEVGPAIVHKKCL